jgi:hypothetical protein
MPQPKRREATQTHGQSSRGYVPILREIVRRNHTPGTQTIEFTIRDIREIASELGIEIGNAADMSYSMRSRTRLPDDILDLGFTVLRGVGRGKYALEVGGEAIVHLPEHDVYDHNDQTPLPVRRLLPEDLSELDEQGLLTMVSYCKLLDHFTGLTVYQLRSHVRKSVPNLGQAELDEIDVGVLRTLFPAAAHHLGGSRRGSSPRARAAKRVAARPVLLRYMHLVLGPDEVPSSIRRRGRRGNL